MTAHPESSVQSGSEGAEGGLPLAAITLWSPLATGGPKFTLPLASLAPPDVSETGERPSFTSDPMPGFDPGPADI